MFIVSLTPVVMFIVSDIQTDTQILELRPLHSVQILHAYIVHIVLTIST